MKKLLLSFAALAFAASFTEMKAQSGATCEDAIAPPVYIDGSAYPDGVWFTWKVTEGSLFPSSTPPRLEDGSILVYEDCGGRSAIKLSTNTFYLEPDKEYKVFAKLRSSDFFFPGAMSLAGAPAGFYCVKPIVLEGLGQSQTIDKAKTLWYQIESKYNAPLVVKSSDIGFPPATNVTKVVTKHLTCDGGTNESNELLPYQTYLKAGINLVQVTTNGEGNIMFQLDAMSATGCGNGASHAVKMELDTESTLPNAYYTVSRRYTIPETGYYTFTMHAAEGSELKVALLDGNNCDFDTKPVSAEAGSETDAVVAAEYNAGDEVILQADMSGALEGSLPFVKVSKGNSTTVTAVSANSTKVKVSENPTNGQFTITSYLLKNGADVCIYDMGAKRVWNRTAPAGSDTYNVDATNLPAGSYLLVVYGPDRSATAKLIIK